MTESTTPATPPSTAQKLGAEAIGTFLLVLVGCASIAVPAAAIGGGADDFAVLALLTVPLAFGLTYAAAGYAFGRVSGGHFNPAVSIGSALAGRTSWKDAAAYSGVQVGGGILAAALLVALLSGFEGYDAFENTLGANGWGDEGTGYAWWATILLELFVTAVFVLVHLAAYDKRGDRVGFAPLATGFALAAIYFATLLATGGGTNPARAIGPALFSGADALIQVGLFIIAPLLGAAAAGLIYPPLFGRDADPVPGSGLALSGGGSRSAYPAQGGYGAYPGGQAWGQPGQAGFAGQQPGQFGGYGQPQAGGYGAPVEQQAQPAPVEQPIIQDGWQWDPQAQQWIPAQQGGWPPGGEQTQIR